MILVTGGARSGKSTFAEALATRLAAAAADAEGEPGSARVTYLATSETNDPEMAARVAAHRSARPSGWTTVESPLEVGAALRASVTTTPRVVLLDCVTFWVSNLLFAGGDLGDTMPEGLGDFSKDFIPAEVERQVGERIDDALADLLAALNETGATLVAVTNEVGLGVVPEYPIARLYRDELGRVNRRLASAASRVYLLVSGLPLEITSLAVPWPSASEPAPPAASHEPAPPAPSHEPVPPSSVPPSSVPPPSVSPASSSPSPPSSPREEEKEHDS